MTPYKSTPRQRPAQASGAYGALSHNTLAMPLRSSLCANTQARAFCCALVVLVAACACAFVPRFAFAEDIDTDPTPSQLQLEVERTAAALDEATQKADQAAIDLADNEARIAELKELIPGQQVRSDAAARELYKINQQPYGILDALLSSRSLNDFIVQLDYVNRVTDANLAEIQRLTNMKKELEESQQALEQLKADADAQVNQAATALAAAQQARMEAQRKAEEEARRQAEAAAAAAAAAQSAKQAQEKAGQSESQDQEGEHAEGSSEGNGQDAANAAAATAAASEEAVTQVNDTANWSSDQASFVSEWTARIDAYLAGSPLAGYGRNFAEAAWAYGVDPRWSPAISCTESGKGAQCFMSHNAWGWGSVSWDSWEEAIDSHVRGLARGYGYTISRDAARKYCPPNANHWYEFTLSQMNSI